MKGGVPAVHDVARGVSARKVQPVDQAILAACDVSLQRHLGAERRLAVIVFR